MGCEAGEGSAASNPVSSTTPVNESRSPRSRSTAVPAATSAAAISRSASAPASHAISTSTVASSIRCSLASCCGFRPSTIQQDCRQRSKTGPIRRVALASFSSVVDTGCAERRRRRQGPPAATPSGSARALTTPPRLTRQQGGRRPRRRAGQPSWPAHSFRDEIGKRLISLAVCTQCATRQRFGLRTKVPASEGVRDEASPAWSAQPPSGGVPRRCVHRRAIMSISSPIIELLPETELIVPTRGV
jgi:hypothetical protein